MTRILLLETSAAKLSVALSEDGRCVAERICEEPRMQASLTAPLVKEVLDSLGLKVKDCDAVCLSKGPGSYTGLRVGSSTAKGLCFGAGIPLLAVDTTDILAASVPADGASFIVPMIDARRMEVYTSVYTPDGKRITEIEAKVVGPDSFADYLVQGPVLFTGDGALKCREILTGPQAPYPGNALFREACPLASDMAPLAQKAYDDGRFEDLAYFEPFYLKDFVATKPRDFLHA